MKKNLFELRREREAHIAAGRAIVDAAIEAKQNLTPEQSAQIESHRAAAQELQNQIALFETRDEFDSMRAARARGDVDPSREETDDLPDLSRYSILRAMRSWLAVREGTLHARFDGLEAEVHQELLRRRPSLPGSREVRGVLVPWGLRTTVTSGRREQRDVTTTTASGGIQQTLNPTLIEYLRNRMVMSSMGAQVITGVVGGSWSMPRQNATGTAYHVGEGSSPTASNLTLGLVTWSPRTLAAKTTVTRATLLQTSPDIEAIVRNSLINDLATEYDRVGVNGEGTGQIPLGIMQDPTVPTTAIGTNGGAATWAMVCALEKSVAASNADFGSLGYVTSNAGRSALKQTPKIGSTFPVFMWEKGAANGEGEVNSYRALASEQIPSNLVKGSGTSLTALVFGNWASATYAMWSAIEITLDPYTAGDSGGLVMRGFVDYDFRRYYVNDFAKCVDITTS